MKRHAFTLTPLFAALALTSPLHAINLDKATVTEVVNNVTMIERATKKSAPARVKEVFSAPNVLRTGADSRAELIAADQTVTRVGQNTLFSFQPGSRDINLDKGSILFQSPTGNGGGTIRTPAASAAVLGTTLIVTTTKNGGFKVLLVEGRGRVRATDGTVRTLNSGQMVYAVPGGKLSQVFDFHLSQQVGASGLIKGFKSKLSSAAKISAAIARQERLFKDGRLILTNLLASSSPGYAYQVEEVAHEVLVEQTVAEEAQEVTPFATALTKDAIVAGPDLDPESVFTFDGPNAPEIEAPVRLGATPFEARNIQGTGSSDAAMFAAKTIVFRTPRVNLAPYEKRSVFEFLSIGDTTFEGSVDFDGLSTTELHLVAGGTFKNTPGASLTTDASHVLLISLGSSYPEDGHLQTDALFNGSTVPLELKDFGLAAHGGSVQVLADTMNLSGVSLDAKTDLFMQTLGDLTMKPGSGYKFNGAVSALPKPTAGFNVTKAGKDLAIAAGRDLNVQGLSVEADHTLMVAGRTLKLHEVYIGDRGNAASGIPGSSNYKPNVRLRAADLIDLNNTHFFSTDIAMQARTINLQDVSFAAGSNVVLASGLGLLAYGPDDPGVQSGEFPNNGLKSKTGYVNFIRNVTYDGQDATNKVNGPNDKPGIIIQKIGKPASNGFRP